MAKYSTPEQVLLSWLDAINAGDLEAVASMYTPDAVLIPTFFNRRLRTPDERKSYFDRLSKKGNLAVELHKKPLLTQQITPGLHCLSGIYCWHFDDEDGELLYFEARFTFVVDLDCDTPVVHQHSSQIPRSL